MKAALFRQPGGPEVLQYGGPARFLLLSAQPLDEPSARWGPFVMNTPEEIQQALQELRAGTFVRARPDVRPG